MKSNGISNWVRRFLGRFANADKTIQTGPRHYQARLKKEFVDNGKLVYNIAISGITEEDIQMVNVETRETKQFLFVRYQGELTAELLRYEIARKVNPEKSEAEFSDGMLTVRLPLDEESILS